MGQRIAAIALGYEDVDDHDTLRHDPVLALVSESLTPKREDCAVLAGKSTLNRLELSRVGEPTRYHKHDMRAIEALFVDLFLEAHDTSPGEIVLDLDATDDPLHGRHEGRFFHGYYTTVTATCRSTSSAAGTCWRQSSGVPTSTPARERSRRSSGSCGRSAGSGAGCALSCAPIPALPGKS
ncbi:hypothetical protein X750_28585 [Mesorhizobium sp. LNJC394B00]|nr:hypothetical protein X750_28585 [Mesorhizobium sp. LNJC394B00]